MRLAFVIPVLNERETLEPLAAGIARHASPHEYQILFVDDGSADGSYDVLRSLHERDPRVGLLKLRRNYGKTRALAAGIACAEGDVLITMDADLQDDPEEIPRLLAKLDEGYDVVCGWKADRHDPWHKVLPSRVYNALVNWLFGLRLHDINSGFKAMRMDIAKRLPLFGDMHRMMAVFAANMGGNVTETPVVHHPRRFGKSKYGFKRFYEGSRDALAVWVITRLPHWLNAALRPVCVATALVALAGAAFLAFHREIPGAVVLTLAGLGALFFWRVFRVAHRAKETRRDPKEYVTEVLL